MKTPTDLLKLKAHRKISMLTAYDYPTAKILERAGIDVILVGDSLGTVVFGFPDTLSVTLADILRHTQAVTRGAPDTCVVADLPIGTYETSPAQALEHARACLEQGKAQAIKLEGGVRMEKTILSLVQARIPVMGHVGLTPQSVDPVTGYRVYGKTPEEKEAIFQDALAVERAGAFAIVLECVEKNLAQKITNTLKIPTIGIGSGLGCDGQVLVIHDLLGFTLGHVPAFVKPQANLKETIFEAVKKYMDETQQGKI